MYNIGRGTALPITRYNTTKEGGVAIPRIMLRAYAGAVLFWSSGNQNTTWHWNTTGTGSANLGKTGSCVDARVLCGGALLNER